MKAGGIAMAVGVLALVALAWAGGRFLGRGESNAAGRTSGEAARAHVQALGGKIEKFAADNARPPASLYELTIAEGQGPYAGRDSLIDPWERQYYYRVDEKTTAWTVFTLGADGVIGGDGANADLAHDSPR